MGQARWLDDEQQRTWRALLAMNLLLGEALDRQLRQDAGMPHAYYQILAMLSEADGRALRMSSLARLTGYSASRLSHAVARLEDAGWVRREPTDEDRRGAVAVLTDAGFATLVEAAPGHVETVRRHLFDRLSPEQVRHLRTICETAVEGLDPDSGCFSRTARGSSPS